MIDGRATLQRTRRSLVALILALLMMAVFLAWLDVVAVDALDHQRVLWGQQPQAWIFELSVGVFVCLVYAWKLMRAWFLLAVASWVVVWR